MALAATAGLVATPDKENVVASRLEGGWVLDPALTKRLGLGSPGEPGLRGSVAFQVANEEAGVVPEKYAQFFKGRPVFLAGWMRRGGEAAPHRFLLTTVHGNPHVVYFRERDGDPMGDAESFNVMLARGDKPAQDLLFIGGDFNNQPFRAYRRTTE